MRVLYHAQIRVWLKEQKDEGCTGTGKLGPNSDPELTPMLCGNEDIAIYLPIFSGFASLRASCFTSFLPPHSKQNTRHCVVFWAKVCAYDFAMFFLCKIFLVGMWW